MSRSRVTLAIALLAVSARPAIGAQYAAVKAGESAGRAGFYANGRKYPE